jgi:hypothetical protein
MMVESIVAALNAFEFPGTEAMSSEMPEGYFSAYAPPNLAGLFFCASNSGCYEY